MTEGVPGVGTKMYETGGRDRHQGKDRAGEGVEVEVEVEARTEMEVEVAGTWKERELGNVIRESMAEIGEEGGMAMMVGVTAVRGEMTIDTRAEGGVRVRDGTEEVVEAARGEVAEARKEVEGRVIRGKEMGTKRREREGGSISRRLCCQSVSSHLCGWGGCIESRKRD